jgi:hypothetical protein
MNAVIDAEPMRQATTPLSAHSNERVKACRRPWRLGASRVTAIRLDPTCHLLLAADGLDFSCRPNGYSRGLPQD